MELHNVCLVMELIRDNPNIDNKKFFRHQGSQCKYYPSTVVLFEEHITGAIAVIHNTPIFAGDKLWYHSNNYTGFVTITEYEDNKSEGGERKYYFIKEGYSLPDIIISKIMLETLLFLDKPKPTYETISYNSSTIRKIVTARDSMHTLKVADSKGNIYWADSTVTVASIHDMLQTIADDILKAVSLEKSVRVLIDGNAKHLIRKINT